MHLIMILKNSIGMKEIKLEVGILIMPLMRMANNFIRIEAKNLPEQTAIKDRLNNLTHQNAMNDFQLL